METDSPFSPEVQQRLDALPEDIRNLVYSSDMAAIIQQIGAKHQLHIDQIGALEAEAAAAMLGITKLEEFSENVVDTLNIDEQKSAAIVADVNEMLFKKIQNSMKALYDKKTGSESVSASSTPPPPPQPKAQPAPVAPIAPTPAAPTTSAPAPVAAKPAAVVPPPAQTPPSTSSGQAKPDLSAAENMLQNKTVSVPVPPAPPAVAPAPTPAPAPAVKQEPPKPTNYTADPYREPPTP